MGDVIEAAKQRALDIAKKLSSSRTLTVVDDKIGSLLGKRDAEYAFTVGNGEKRTKKVYMPTGMKENFIGLLIGPKGKTQRDIEQRDGCTIAFKGRGAAKDPSDADADDAMHVLVTGESDAQVTSTANYVERLMFNDTAREELKKKQLVDLGLVTTAVNSAAGGAERKFNLANDKVGLLVGRGGDNLKRIESATGVKIQIAPDSTYERPNERLITISGAHEGVLQRAEAEIMSSIDTLLHSGATPTAVKPGVGYVSTTQMPPGPPYNLPGIVNAMELIFVPNSAVGLIIGKGGDTLKTMQMKTGAHLQIVRDAMADLSKPERAMGLSGTREQMEQARNEIMSYVNQALNKQSGGLNGFNASNSETMYIPHGQTGTVIGKGGDMIRSIAAKTGAKCQICPDTSGPERGVMLAGTRDQMDAARAEINRIIQEKIGQNAAAANPYSQYGSYGASYGAYGGAAAGFSAYAPYDPNSTAAAVTTDPTAAATTAAYGYDYAAYYQQQQAAMLQQTGQPAYDYSTVPQTAQAYDYSAAATAQQGQPAAYDYSAYYAQYYQQQAALQGQTNGADPLLAATQPSYHPPAQ